MKSFTGLVAFACSNHGAVRFSVHSGNKSLSLKFKKKKFRKVLNSLQRWVSLVRSFCDLGRSNLDNLKNVGVQTYDDVYRYLCLIG